MIQIARPVRRKVTSERRQPLVVALTPEGIWLREPRRRRAFLLPYGAAYHQAARLAVLADRRQTQVKKKNRAGR